MILSKISSLFVGDAIGRSILEEFRVALDPTEVLSGASSTSSQRHRNRSDCVTESEGKGTDSCDLYYKYQFREKICGMINVPLDLASC